MSHSAILTWTASTDAVAGYNVYRGTNPPGNEGATPINSALIAAPTTTYTDTSVVAGQKYDYVVTAVSASGVESVHSNEVTATVPVAAPTNLTATVS
jgi:fibronectin type 3 domain-containing protein